nr:hypothetical protein [Tanacetum cinerariifolium]
MGCHRRSLEPAAMVSLCIWLFAEVMMRAFGLQYVLKGIVNCQKNWSSLLTQTWIVDFVSGRKVIDAAHHKRVKCEAKCTDIRYEFLSFSISSFGELDKDAVTLLKRIRKFFVTQDIGARAAVHIFNRISFAIAKEWELS